MTPTLNETRKGLNVEELKALARQGGPCVTIQLPAYQPGSGGGSRQAHLRQLTQKALDELRNFERHGETAAALESLLATLPLDHGGPAMTLYCAPGFEAAYETPGVHEQVTVGDHFYLLPQLTRSLAPQDFFILSLSRNHLRLFHYEYGRCVELPLPAGVPASLEAVGAFDKADHNVEGRAPAGPSMGNMRGVRFGISSDHDSEAEYLRHFFELIDRGLKNTLRGAPLFLAGVREDIGLYRKAAKYTHILGAECHGNPEHSSLEQVAKHAAAGALREYEAARQRAFQAASDTRNKLMEPDEILVAANAGRIRQLFVAEEAPPEKRAVLNRAVVEGLRTGANVFGFAGTELPEFGSLMAILRY